MRARFGDRTEVQERPTLADIGIDKKLSSHAQKVAAIPAAEFKGIVGQWRDTLETENERVVTNIIWVNKPRRRRSFLLGRGAG